MWQHTVGRAFHSDVAHGCCMYSTDRTGGEQLRYSGLFVQRFLCRRSPERFTLVGEFYSECAVKNEWWMFGDGVESLAPTKHMESMRMVGVNSAA